MGMYRRKDREGRPYGPYIVQYPYTIDPVTGKTRYKTLSVSHSKRLASKVLSQKVLDWEKRKHLGLEAKPDLTFRQLADWYLKLPSTQKLKSLKKVQEHCQTLKARFGNMVARDVRPYMVEEYQVKRLAEKTRRGTPYKPASVNRELEVLKRIFSLAVREDFLDKNPCMKVKKLPEENARNRMLSYGEFLKLTEALPRHAADIVRIGYYTGMRVGEIVGLTWGRTNLKEGYIDLTPGDTKTGKRRRVYLLPQALEVLERASKIRSIAHDYVFTYQGRPIKSIKGAIKTGLKSTGTTGFTFHDLRRTFNTNMRKAGVEDVVTMELTGHRTLSMYLRYSTVDSKDAKEAMSRLRDFLDRESRTTANPTAEREKGSGETA